MTEIITTNVSPEQAWSHAWSFRAYRIQTIVTFLLLASFTIAFTAFFDFVESRNGKVLDDLLLDHIPAYNVSWLIFFFLYSGIFCGLYFHRSHPKTVLMCFQTYVIVTLIRMITITLIPLNPPAAYIPLREPFVQLFTSGGKIISKDLFFSGHMSTILSLYFSSHKKFPRTYLLFSSLMIGLLLLVQHVHYTVDVLVAIPSTYLIYLFCKRFLAWKTF